MKLPVKLLHPRASLPAYSQVGDAALDLRCVLDEPIELLPGRRHLFRTGIAMAIPRGWVGLLMPRSGLSFKLGMEQTPAPGTIDPNYRGEVCVGLWNVSERLQLFTHGDRVTQLILVAAPEIDVVAADELDDTIRGAGGFGSSGR